MKRSSYFVLGFLLCFALQANAQLSVSWTQLAKVQYGPVAEDGFALPDFGEDLKALEGKLIVIEGYMLPLTVDNQRYILSRYPFYNCYFCGNAGRETVIELYPEATDWEFEIDDKVKIQGKLKLVSDEESLIFELLEAEEVD